MRGAYERLRVKDSGKIVKMRRLVWVMAAPLMGLVPKSHELTHLEIIQYPVSLTL